MARDAIAFFAARGFSQVDLLGFSIGSFVAQQITLTRPDMVRKLVLASSVPQGAVGLHGWAPEIIGAIGTPHQPGSLPGRVLHPVRLEPGSRHRSAAAHIRPDRGPGHGHDVADTRGPV
jgi:pimeloyl-ACP methyl ester carboxylesterase